MNNSLKWIWRGFGWLLMAGCGTAPLSAEVTRFEIRIREPYANGQSFEGVGPYERIVGRVHYRLDPASRQNRAVVDLHLAPRNAEGFVEFSADLFLLAPRDLVKGNGALLYDVNNRGNKLALKMFNDSTDDAAGNGFLFRQGFVIVWSGWDGELLPDEEQKTASGNQRLQLFAPRVADPHGEITGLVRCEIAPTENLTRSNVSWANHASYRPTTRGIEEAVLTHRLRPEDDRLTVPRSQWRMIVTEASDSPSQLPKIEIDYPAGFQRGHLYELIYEAHDPLVLGTGFTAVRDLIAALRQGTGVDNPLLRTGQPSLSRAYAFGVSQSGRFLREFLYSGFNEDEQGRPVFNGVIPHVAGGGLGSFNHRFAQPTRHAAQHDHADYPPDRFPFAYEDQCDPLSGRCDGILKRSRENGTAPLVFHTQSSAEYWTRSGSLPHTDPLAERDAEPGDGVRFFTFGGTQHGPSGYPPERGPGRNLANPGDYRPFLRALLLAMDQHVAKGGPLPNSIVPRIDEGTLVDWSRSSTGFPSIPGVPFPEVIREPPLLDFGPDWLTQGLVTKQPPLIDGRYRVRVPRCGSDGNELGCLLPPEVAVPIGTYTGWNTRRAEMGPAGQLISLTGSFIPFATTANERKQSHDPPLSIEERYGTHAEYVRQLEQECRRLAAQGLLLPEDRDRIIALQAERTKKLFEQIPPK